MNSAGSRRAVCCVRTHVYPAKIKHNKIIVPNEYSLSWHHTIHQPKKLGNYLVCNDRHPCLCKYYRLMITSWSWLTPLANLVPSKWASALGWDGAVHLAVWAAQVSLHRVGGNSAKIVIIWTQPSQLNQQRAFMMMTMHSPPQLPWSMMW